MTSEGVPHNSANRYKLISQRIYQIVTGYEDSNDSNDLRHDPISKMVCDRVPIVREELLGSQPTMSRLENQITQKEIKRLRRFFLDKFLESYEEAPSDGRKVPVI